MREMYFDYACYGGVSKGPTSAIVSFAPSNSIMVFSLKSGFIKDNQDYKVFLDNVKRRSILTDEEGNMVFCRCSYDFYDCQDDINNEWFGVHLIPNDLQENKLQEGKTYKIEFLSGDYSYRTSKDLYVKIPKERHV
ncbi:MAG: hypothetical protein ACRC5C_03965 [Bacilli bacterium]